MKITCVGHTSVLVEKGVGLLTDPWLKGGAFSDSRTLHSQPVLRLTHIWISHEHPDHLSIPTLKSLPAELKSDIEVLFQEHCYTEVVDWLKNQGDFQEVREMPHSARMAISPVLRVACYQVVHIDPALTIKSPLYTILNLEHCDTHIPAMKRLRHQLGHMNLLLDQFSIAGNRKDVDRRRFTAGDVLDSFVRDIKHIEPDFVLPFPSLSVSHTRRTRT